MNSIGSLRVLGTCISTHVRRNFGISAVAAQKLDPVQQLFVDKIREYAKKSKAAGGGLVDVTPESKKSLDDELKKLESQYNASGKDMSQFPTFNFTDQELARPDLGINPSEHQREITTGAGEAVSEDKQDPNAPFFQAIQ